MNCAICRLHTTVSVIQRLRRQSAGCPRDLKSADCAVQSADCANPQIARNTDISIRQNKCFKRRYRRWGGTRVLYCPAKILACIHTAPTSFPNPPPPPISHTMYHVPPCTARHQRIDYVSVLAAHFQIIPAHVTIANEIQMKWIKCLRRVNSHTHTHTHTHTLKHTYMYTVLTYVAPSCY